MPVSCEDREFVFERANWACQYCGRHGVNLVVDHIVPAGNCWEGADHPGNLAASCDRCNGIAKSRRFCDLAHKREWIQQMIAEGYEITKEHSWDDHRWGRCPRPTRRIPRAPNY